MARPAGPQGLARRWPFALPWRRPTVRVFRSLWLQASAALLAAYLLILPLVVLAAGWEREAVSVGAGAWAEARLQADIGRLGVGLARQHEAVRGYVLTGDRSFLPGYELGRSEVAAARSAAATDAADGQLERALLPVAAAADAWQEWAVGQVRRRDASRAAPDPSDLLEGDRLLAAFHAAAGRLDAAAGRAVDRDRARSDALHRLVQRSDLLLLLIGGGLIVVLGSILVAVALRPVSRLAVAATSLAAGARTAVPYTGRHNEVGALARALTRWQRSEVSRRAVLEHSPIGLFTLAPDLRLVDVNPALRTMFGVPMDDVTPAVLGSFLHPDEVESGQRLRSQLLSGATDHATLEQRYVRRDGSVFWGSLTAVVVRRADGSPSHYVCMIEDVSDRRERMERAARVQRELLPDAPPELEGYELAGLCRPGQEMGGDFFDWHPQGPGRLVVTLGDVMGKDMPAALLMAIVRIALRTTARRSTVGEAVRSVAASIERDLSGAGAFVTLFHGRLDLETGVLRYVDAGHGLAVVAGDGGVRRLAGRGALPLGVLAGEGYEESSVRLRPGEALLVFSDGVLDVHPELDETLRGVGGLIDGGENAQTSAQEMAERLASGPGTASDDVTVLVLRRLPVAAAVPVA